MDENPETVYDYIYKNKGFFYLCGTAASSIDGCRAACVDAIVKGGHSREDAEQFMIQMQIEGRWNIDLW